MSAILCFLHNIAVQLAFFRPSFFVFLRHEGCLKHRSTFPADLTEKILHLYPKGRISSTHAQEHSPSPSIFCNTSPVKKSLHPSLLVASASRVLSPFLPTLTPSASGPTTGEPFWFTHCMYCLTPQSASGGCLLILLGNLEPTEAGTETPYRERTQSQWASMTSWPCRSNSVTMENFLQFKTTAFGWWNTVLKYAGN